MERHYNLRFTGCGSYENRLNLGTLIFYKDHHPDQLLVKATLIKTLLIVS